MELLKRCPMTAGTTWSCLISSERNCRFGVDVEIAAQLMQVTSSGYGRLLDGEESRRSLAPRHGHFNHVYARLVEPR
jgi:hypothetical protein